MVWTKLGLVEGLAVVGLYWTLTVLVVAAMYGVAGPAAAALSLAWCVVVFLWGGRVR